MLCSLILVNWCDSNISLDLYWITLHCNPENNNLHSHHEDSFPTNILPFTTKCFC
jgi:hypothetical protein